MTLIPLDPIGYAVSSDGTIHTRYAGDHAGDAQRTRTVKGVETLLAGKEGTACSLCYPSPRYAETGPKVPQKRRTGPRKKKG